MVSVPIGLKGLQDGQGRQVIVVSVPIGLKGLQDGQGIRKEDNTEKHKC